MASVIFTALLYGFVQGVTEWLPISSTGHLLLLSGLLPLPLSERAADLHLVLVQLSSVLAVCVLYRKELGLCRFGKAGRKEAFSLWKKLILASIPVALCGVIFGYAIKAFLRTDTVIAFSLIALGVLFLFADKRFSENRRERIDTKRAFGIGVFQCASLIPGVSRSGASMFGAQVLGVERSAAARFSFFLAIPAMAGAGAYELYGFFTQGFALDPAEVLFLFISALVSFAVSLFAMRFLVRFVKRRGFFAFGVYRVVLGCAILCRNLFL